MNLSDGSIHATDVNINEITLLSPTGSSVSLMHLYSEINVFEDLFSQTMSGNIVVHDSLDLINKIPILGYEYLIIVFGKPGQSTLLKKIFRVYKITDRTKINQQHESYILHFISEEMLLSEKILVSKSYKEKQISDIIQDIAKNYLGINSEKLSTSRIETTYGLNNIIIPSWHPFYAINWLAKRAIGIDKTSSFVWFENINGFNFTSIETLFKKAPIDKIHVSPKTAGINRDDQTNIEISQKGVESYLFRDVFDTLKNINYGMYGGELITFDPIRRRIATNILKHSSFFKSTKHAEKYPILIGEKDRFKKEIDEYTTANRKVYPAISNIDDIKYGKGKISQRANNVEKWMLQRDMYLSSIHSMRMTLIIPGSLNYSVGNTIDLKLPVLEEQEKPEKKLDQLFSGKYLITAVRHKIDRKNYACIMEISKDSINHTLNVSENATLNKVKGL